MKYYYREEDLPEDVRKVLQQPCTSCGKKGIHNCIYNEEIMKDRLEEETIFTAKKRKKKND